MINVALPKGRLGEKVYAMLDNAGYGISQMESDSRKLVFFDEKQDVRYFWVKPSDVPIYVERGVADIGVAGKDVLMECDADVYELLDLCIGKCKMCVAGKTDFRDERTHPLKVATKFVNVTKKHYDSQNRQIDIIKLSGSIELAPILNLSDVIVDIVETGTTLKENGLRVFEEIFDISARLVANKSSYKFIKSKIDDVCTKLKREIR